MHTYIHIMKAYAYMQIAATIPPAAPLSAPAHQSPAKVYTHIELADHPRVAGVSILADWVTTRTIAIK